VNFSAEQLITVNPTFFCEIKDENLEVRHLLRQARNALTGPGPIRKLWARFVEVLRPLCDRLAAQFDLEETYGYFANPSGASTRVSRRARALQSQHAALISELRAICDQAEQRLREGSVPLAPRRIVQEFDAFCSRLQDHDAGEEDLIFLVVKMDRNPPIKVG